MVETDRQDRAGGVDGMGMGDGLPFGEELMCEGGAGDNVECCDGGDFAQIDDCRVFLACADGVAEVRDKLSNFLSPIT